VQFAISPAALRIAVELSSVDMPHIGTIPGRILPVLPAGAPAGAPQSVTDMFAQVAALRALVSANPDMAALTAALRDLLVNHIGNTPQAVIDVWNPIAGSADADLMPLLAVIQANPEPNDGAYLAIKTAATALRDAISLPDRRNAARVALMNTLVPDGGLPVPLAVIYAVSTAVLALDGGSDNDAKIAALTQLRTAITMTAITDSPVSARAREYDTTLAAIDPGAATDEAKQACVASFTHLNPADPLHDAIVRYNEAVRTAVQGDAVALETAKQAFISDAIDVDPVDSRVSAITPQYEQYTTAKALVTSTEQAVVVAQAAVTKLTKPTDANADDA